MEYKQLERRVQDLIYLGVSESTQRGVCVEHMLSVHRICWIDTSAEDELCSESHSNGGC